MVAYWWQLVVLEISIVDWEDLRVQVRDYFVVRDLVERKANETELIERLVHLDIPRRKEGAFNES